MKKLFLTSIFAQVADKLAPLVPNPKGMKAAFIPTARDPYEKSPWADIDFHKLQEIGFETAMYDIKGKTEEQIYNDLKKFDVIFVCGGNTFYLLYHARQSGFDKAVIRLIDEGKVYIGSSAGSLLVGPSLEPIKNLDKISAAPELKSLVGLNIVNIIVLPHFDTEKYRERNEKALRDYKDQFKMIAINDDQAVIVEGDNYKVV